MSKVEDMEYRHTQEMSEINQTQSQLMLSKEHEILTITAHTNKEVNRLKAMVKAKNDEIEKLKRYLEEIEEDLLKMKWLKWLDF